MLDWRADDGGPSDVATRLDAAGGFSLGGATLILHAPLNLFIVATEPLSLAYLILVSLTFVLLVFTSVPYDPGDYVRHYAEFLGALKTPEIPE